MQRIAIINGPNLDRLGRREPEVYGSETLADLEKQLGDRVAERDPKVELSFFQSNHEGRLIDEISRCSDASFTGLIINPAAFTHSSIALRDALAAAPMPCVEVHISNIYQRETFRRTSLTATACRGVISGLGLYGYLAAMDFLLHVSTK